MFNRKTSSNPDYFQAERHVSSELKNLPKTLYFHSILHTKEVVEATTRLASSEGIDFPNFLLLKTAALYHDIGYVTNYQHHEEAGANLVKRVLPSFGYSSEDIGTICQMILATELPQNPKTYLQKILCDADLDNLGRQDFFVKTELLRLERLNCGDRMTPREWYVQTLGFLKNHKYFTKAAKKLRQKKKEQNVQEIKELLGLDD
jgi:uncharacterized protein